MPVDSPGDEAVHAHGSGRKPVASFPLRGERRKYAPPRPCHTGRTELPEPQEMPRDFRVLSTYDTL